MAELRSTADADLHSDDQPLRIARRQRRSAQPQARPRRTGLAVVQAEAGPLESAQRQPNTEPALPVLLVFGAVLICLSSSADHALPLQTAEDPANAVVRHFVRPGEPPQKPAESGQSLSKLRFQSG